MNNDEKFTYNFLINNLTKCEVLQSSGRKNNLIEFQGEFFTVYSQKSLFHTRIFLKNSLESSINELIISDYIKYSIKEIFLQQNIIVAGKSYIILFKMHKLSQGKDLVFAVL